MDETRGITLNEKKNTQILHDLTHVESKKADLREFKSITVVTKSWGGRVGERMSTILLLKGIKFWCAISYKGNDS